MRAAWVYSSRSVRSCGSCQRWHSGLVEYKNALQHRAAPHESCRSELFRFPWRSRPECVYMSVDVGKNRSGSLLCRHGLHLLPDSESSLSADRPRLRLKASW